MDNKITNVSVGDDGTVWCIDEGQRVWARQANQVNWVLQADARAVLASVARQDHIWLLNNQGDLFQREGTKWTRQTGLPKIMDVSTGSDGTVWAIDTNQGMWVRTHVVRTWQQDTKGKAVHVTVANQNQIWCLNSGGDIYKREGDAWVIRKQKSGAIALDVGLDGALWYVGGAGQLFRPSGTDWVADPTMKTVLQVSVRNQGEVWVVTFAGEIWQMKNGKWSRVTEPRLPTRVYVVQKGDSLTGIAAKEKVDYNKLLQANPQIKNPNVIKEGDRLNIPID